MGTTISAEVLLSALVDGRSLALVNRSLSGPSLSSVVDVVLRYTARIGETQYDVMVLKTIGSAAAQHLSVEDPTAVLLNVATAVDFLHTIDGTRSLVHGNLNIDALCMVGGVVIISGFEHCSIQPPVGASQPSDGSDWQRLPPGELLSMAPELVASGIRTTQTDVYAFGMLMFRMYAGEYPFARLISSSRFVEAAPVRLGVGKRPPREAIAHRHFSDELWALMDECWAQNSSARPTMADVRARIEQLMGDRASRSRGDDEQSVPFETD